MERGLFDVLFALGAAGCDHLFGVIQREREAWERERTLLIETSEREREAWERERTLLIETAERERTLLTEVHNSHERERDMLSAQLQFDLDVALGHATVRTVLEQIVNAAFPGKTSTDALNKYCNDPEFLKYLDSVSAVTHFGKADLIKSAKSAYSALSETIHHGSTLSEVNTVPQAVLRDKCMLYALSAIFKYGRRNVRFYLGNPRDLLDVPSPMRTPHPSPAPSAATTPPKTVAAAAS
jgi:hypothetical protein